MDNQEILSIYQEVAGITSQMLLAARNSDWDSLISLELRCSQHVDRLKHHDLADLLPANMREQKMGIIRKILADDQEIRNLTQPRLAQLSSLLANSGNERRLHQVYNANNTG